MNDVVFLMSVLVIMVGSYLFALRVLLAAVSIGKVRSVFGGSKAEAYSFLLLSFLAWAIGTGLRSLIPVWGFFGNMPLSTSTLCNGLAGIGLVILGWPIIGEHHRWKSFANSQSLDLKEKVVVSVICILGLLYVYRSFLPWSDHDEAAIYGYLTKLIAGGRTFGDVSREGGPLWFTRSYLVQSWDAQLYALVNDTYFVRINRLLNLVFCGVGVFAFLRLVNVRRLWALMGVLLFWATPELSYLALSLKVDAVVMMFELAAFFAVITATLFHVASREGRCDARVPFHLSLGALLLAAFAFGNRFSGVIPMFLCAGCAVFFLSCWIKRPLVSFGVVFVAFAAVAFIAAPGYWINLALYHNPTYPVKGFWPFQNGAYSHTVDFFTSRWNIVGLAPGVLQAYLLFALASGIELIAKAVPFLNAFPMALSKTESMGWPYPLILCALIWPFFRKGHRALDSVVAVFLFQFISWSMGLHYSRLFVASATLMTISSVMMASYPIPSEDRAMARGQRVLKGWIIFSLVVSLMMQIWWAQKRYFGPILIGAQARHEARASFLKTKDYKKKNILTWDEVLGLEHIFLGTRKNSVVCVLTSNQDVMHILFDSHIYIKPFDGVGDYVLLEPGYAATLPWDVMQSLHRAFPRKVMTTPKTGWEVFSAY